MRPREALSDGMVDLYIGRVLKHWARSVPPPADGKSRLLDSLTNSKRLQPLSYKSVAVAVQELLIEILSPSIAPTAQPMLYLADYRGIYTATPPTHGVVSSRNLTRDLTVSYDAWIFSLVV